MLSVFGKHGISSTFRFYLLLDIHSPCDIVTTLQNLCVAVATLKTLPMRIASNWLSGAQIVGYLEWISQNFEARWENIDNVYEDMIFCDVNASSWLPLTHHPLLVNHAGTFLHLFYVVNVSPMWSRNTHGWDDAISTQRQTVSQRDQPLSSVSIRRNLLVNIIGR